MSSIDSPKERELKELLSHSKRLASDGKLLECFQALEQAYEIQPQDKILRRIERIKSVLGYDPASRNENLDVTRNKSIQQSTSDSTSSYLSPSTLSRFKELKSQAKSLAYEGQYQEAVNRFQEALRIYDCPKVRKYMQEVQSVMSSTEALESDSCNPPEVDEELVTSEVFLEQGSSVSGCAANTINGKVDDMKRTNIEKSTSSGEKSSSNSELSESDHNEKLAQVKEAYEEARQLAEDGQLEKALKFLQKAQSIYKTEKVRKRIEKIQSVLGYDPASGNENLDVTRNKSIQQSTSSKEKSSSNSELSESDHNEKLAQVKEAYEEARQLAEDGQLEKALKFLQKAQSIYKTEKVRKKIEKIQEYIASDMNTEEDTSVEVAEGFSVHQTLYNKLYPYQREGVRWLWSLFSKGKGGVLADDMGLGKTFQVIAFLSGLIDAELVKHVLIIMPVTLIPTWQNEFEKWCPGIVVNCFHGTSVKDRNKNLLRAQRGGHVLLTTYGLVLSKLDALRTLDGQTFVWDYLILDEGHKIKNPSKTTKAIFEIPSRTRLVLTATPIQNNLREMWSLFDFVLQGTLLGSSKTFKMQYENPISRAREKDATAGEKRLGTEMAENLKSLIQPYFLRRVKDDDWKRQLEEVEQRLDKLKITSLKKNDLILWVYLSDIQLEIYQEFLHSDAVKSILLTKKSPLVELTVLKKICDHPRLLSQRACLQLGLHGELQAEELMEKIEDETTAAPSIQNVSDEKLLEESGKLKLVVALLENLKSSGHRTLVFSMSRRVLDMLHRILINRNWKVIRIDGTCPLMEREKRIEKFQTDLSYPVFLLTTQVGGVGLTLTAADRVIIYDPSWNPATDAQAVDRAFRIGQEKNVVVYRLITCGTVEEKIYRRQVFKDSITRQTTGDSDPFRYFSKQELRELFKLDDPHYSMTQVQLSKLHQRSSDEKLDLHIEFLKNLGIFGISDHDLMFTGNLQDDSEDHDENAVSEHFIKQKVAAAQNMIKSEASITADGIRLANTYCKPYQEIVPLPKKTPKAPIVPLYEPPTSYEMIDLTDTDKPLPQKLSFSSVKDEVDEDKENKGDFVELEEGGGRHSSKKSNRTLSDEIVVDLTNNNLSSEICPLSPSRKSSISSAKNSNVSPVHRFRESMREKDKQLSRLDAFQELDLDVDLDISRRSIGRKRQSCVRKLPFPTNSDDSSDEVDSSKTAIALVPDSASNTLSSTPQRIKSSLSISESPIIHLSHFEADVLKQGHADSVRRITPLKVGKNAGKKDEYFAQAMATSLIITPYSSPKEGVTGTPQSPSAGDTSVELCNESINETVSSNLDCANKTNSSQISFEEDDMSPIYHRKKGREVVPELNEEEYSSDSDSSILECPSSEADNSTDDNKGDESKIVLKKKSRVVKLVDSDEELAECSSAKDNSILSSPASEANNSIEDNKGDESIIGVKRKGRIVKPFVSDSDEDYEDKYVSALSDPAVTETNYSNNEESSSSKDLESSVSEGRPSQDNVENKEVDESVVSEGDVEVLQSNEHKEDKSNYSETSLLEDSESDYDDESDSGKSVGSESLFDDM